MVTTRRRAYHSSPRAHILDEVLLGIPLETAYQNVCLASGPMDRTEFEYWYYRFYCGRYNLDHDRNQDKLLTQLPLDILDKILKPLGILERANFRNGTTSLRNVIDNEKPMHGTFFNLICVDNRATFYFDTRSLQFKARSNGCRVITDQFTEDEKRQGILGGDYQKCVLREFMAVMRLPGFRLDKLRIKYEQDDDGHGNEFRQTFSRHLQGTFNPHHQQIYLKNIHLDGLVLHSVMSILNSLAPKFLEKLDISNCMEETSGSWEDLVRMEQWQKAKCICMHDASFKIPLEKFFHLPSFEISVDEYTIENLVKIRDTLLPSLNFSHCLIRSKQDIDRRILKAVFPNNNLTESTFRYVEIEFNNREYEVDLKHSSICLTNYH